MFIFFSTFACTLILLTLRGVEWVHGLFLFPLVLGKNVVATCKIGSFLCSLDNFTSEKHNCSLFWK